MMITRFTILFMLSIISSACFCQTRITDIIKIQSTHRVIVKEIDSTQLLLAISPDDYLKVFEIKDGLLVKKDEKYYPELFKQWRYQVSENFFLTSNEEGSIAYDLRDNSEFLIPYDDNNHRTQWSVIDKSLVRLIQSGINYKQMHIDLLTKDVNPRPNSETILNLNENYRRLRREFENDEDEIHIITNLTTQDSVVINTGMLYGGYADFNDHYFIYRKGDQIIKVDNTDFTSSVLMELPTNHSFDDVRLVDKYSLVSTRIDFSLYQLTIIDEFNNIIFNDQVEFELKLVHENLVDNHILFTGTNRLMTFIDVSTGDRRGSVFKFDYKLHDLNLEHLITYSNNGIYLISKDDLSVTGIAYDKLEGSISNVSTIGKDGKHYVCFDTRAEGDNSLFTVIDGTIESSPLLDQENIGISPSPDIRTLVTSEKLVLIEESIFSFDKFGYDQFSTNPASRLFVASYIKEDSEKICWSENNIESRHQIKCFKNDEVIDYGIIPNITTSPSTITLLNFSVQNDNVLYLKSNQTSFGNELRIKKHESGQDSLIGIFSSANSLTEVNNNPYFQIFDSLYTYNFQTDTLQNLSIPVSSNISSLNFTTIKGKVYFSNNYSVFEIDGLDAKQIYEGDINIFLGFLDSFGEYLVVKTPTTYTFINDQTETTVNIGDDQRIKYLGSDYIAIIENNYFDPNSPQILNLSTQESYQLSEDFLDRTLEYIIPNEDSITMISQHRVDDFNQYAIDKFDLEFIDYVATTNVPKLTTSNGKSKLINSDIHSIAILEQTIIFFNNLTGDIVDRITVPGLTSQQEITYKNGILYFVKYESNSGRQIYKYEITPLSNANHYQLEFKIRPNPTSNNLLITSSETFNSWRIISASGHQIMSNLNSDNNIQIDISLVPSGLYILEINNNGNKSSQKFLKL